jgi:hypothetical protein
MAVVKAMTQLGPGLPTQRVGLEERSFRGRHGQSDLRRRWWRHDECHFKYLRQQKINFLKSRGERMPRKLGGRIALSIPLAAANRRGAALPASANGAADLFSVSIST